MKLPPRLTRSPTCWRSRGPTSFASGRIATPPALSANCPKSLADIAADADRKLTDLEGIGKDLAEKIATLLDTGELPMLKELLAEIPAGVLELLRVPGLGPKRAAILHRELKIDSLDQLREACEQHRVRDLKGFGEKTETTILQGLEIAGQAHDRMLWAEADQHAQEILAHMRGEPAVARIEAAGSYRRGKETIGDLDFLVVASDAAAVMDRLAAYRAVAEVLARGETKMSVRLSSGLQVDLRVVAEESFGAALQYFTGSKEHNIVLRGLAKDRGLKINEYGVFRGEKSIAGRTEEEVYAAMDLPCFPPELREARREFDWARQGELPVLVELDDIRGDLHMHSTWTDGQATIEEMAAAAKARGLRLHRHDRPLEAGDDGRRPGRPAHPPAMGGDRQAQRAACGESSCSRPSRSTYSSAAASTWTTTCWPGPTGCWPASTMARISPASRSPAG